MRARVLLDTGPLIAVLNPNDSQHRVCVDQLRTLPVPLLTCWPVITEAAWLLRHSQAALQRLFHECERGTLVLSDVGPDIFPWLSRFFRRYRDLGPQLADAYLVYLAEQNGIDTVFTLDVRDFSTYRINGRHPFNIIPELR